MSAHLEPDSESAPLRMTVAEFLTWDANDPTGKKWQLIDGEPVAMARRLKPMQPCKVRSERSYVIISGKKAMRAAF